MSSKIMSSEILSSEIMSSDIFKFLTEIHNFKILKFLSYALMDSFGACFESNLKKEDCLWDLLLKYKMCHELKFVGLD